MSNQVFGAAKTEVNITDLSIIIANVSKGIACVQGITKRGIPGKQYLITNWAEFKRELGGLLDTDDFPEMCKRALEGGSILRVTRAFHYTDIDDLATEDGTKATGDVEEISPDSSSSDDSSTLLQAGITAIAVGSGYNGLTVTVIPSVSGVSGQIDISVSAPDSDVDQTITGVSQAPTTAELATLNNKLVQVQFDAGTLYIPIGSGVLANGVQTLVSIVDLDYNGSVIGKNGWHSFDDVDDAMRAFNFNKATPTVDAGLVNYCENRKDMIAHTRSPLGLTAQGLEDYREGTGSYSHEAIDSFYGRLTYTDVEINTIEDANAQKTISAFGDVCAIILKKDRLQGEWYSASGPKRGEIKGTRGPITNYYAPGNIGQFNNIYERGVGAVVKISGKTTLWTQRTLLKDKTSLLSKENISDLTIFIVRFLRETSAQEQFDPNDPLMWNELYRMVRPFFVSLVEGRAIRGDDSPTAGEGVWWHWIGDQFATSLSDLVINTQAQVDAGIYKARFAYVPIAATEYIVIDVAPSDSGTIFNISQLSQL